jgi:hypothetical protein
VTALGTIPVAALARWVEGRLDLTIGFVLPVPVVYAADLIDPDLLDDPEAPAARLVPFDPNGRSAHDATVVVMNEWLSPPDTHRRPGQTSPRRRARRVSVVYAGQRAIVTRWEHDPGHTLITLG